MDALYQDMFKKNDEKPLEDKNNMYNKVNDVSPKKLVDQSTSCTNQHTILISSSMATFINLGLGAQERYDQAVLLPLFLNTLEYYNDGSAEDTESTKEDTETADNTDDADTPDDTNSSQ